MNARDSLRSQLVGDRYPPVIEDAGRFRRDWVVRTGTALPADEELNELAGQVNRTTKAAVVAATGSEQAVTVELIRVSDKHLVVRIFFPRPELATADVAAVAQWGALRLCNEYVEIDDLQGLPAAFWWWLRPDAP